MMCCSTVLLDPLEEAVGNGPELFGTSLRISRARGERIDGIDRVASAPKSAR
jgi:hypothetical protein